MSEKSYDVENICYKIGRCKNLFNECLYGNLYEFVNNVFTLQHSMPLMKNKLSNRLKIDTYEPMFSSLNLLEEGLENWTPSTEHRQKYDQYKFSKVAKNTYLYILMLKSRLNTYVYINLLC